MMKCDRCKNEIPNNEEQMLHRQTLCEDCYMDILSVPKTCDPWAVHSAKSFLNQAGAGPKLTEIQLKILMFLSETKGAEPEQIASHLGISIPGLEREVAVLRHMEKVRGELRNGSKFICLW